MGIGEQAVEFHTEGWTPEKRPLFRRNRVGRAQNDKWTTRHQYAAAKIDNCGWTHKTILIKWIPAKESLCHSLIARNLGATGFPYYLEFTVSANFGAFKQMSSLV